MKTKIIAIANQKGGVGKTTTTVNLAAGLVHLGKKVLVIDFDPQANATTYLGFKLNNKEIIYINDIIDSFINDELIDYKKLIITNDENIDYIPSHLKLSSAEMLLINVMNREKVLKSILDNKYFDKYDYILIDCLPSLGILMINALACAHSVIIPVQSQYFALDGLDDFLNTVFMVKKKLNTKLQIEGILRTMTNNTTMSNSVRDNLIDEFSENVFEMEIPSLVEAQKSTYQQKSLINNPKSKIGESYLSLAKTIIERR